MDWLSGARRSAENGRLEWYIVAFVRRAWACEMALETWESDIEYCDLGGRLDAGGVEAGVADACAEWVGFAAGKVDSVAGVEADETADEADLCGRLAVVGLALGGFESLLEVTVEGIVEYVAGFRLIVGRGAEVVLFWSWAPTAFR